VARLLEPQKREKKKIKNLDYFLFFNFLLHQTEHWRESLPTKDVKKKMKNSPEAIADYSSQRSFIFFIALGETSLSLVCSLSLSLEHELLRA
jgi:hypothetical protein